MSLGVANSALLELLQTTIENLPDEEFEIALQYQTYEVCNRWFMSDRVQWEGGTEISRRIVLTNTGTAKMVKPYEKTQIGVVDVMQTITAPWVNSQVHWSISRQEMLRNRSRSKLISLVKGRRVPAKIDMADLIEEQAWGVPNNANDERNARGIPYWVSFADAAAAAPTSDYIGGQIRFGDGSKSRTKAGLATVAGAGGTNDRWKNWAGIYTDFNNVLIKEMRLAWHKVNFRAPVTIEETSKRPFTDYRIYMSQEELVEYEALATAGNDNLGPDVAPFNGMVVFKRTPIIPIPQLTGFTTTRGNDNSDATTFAPQPIYFINHARFYPVVQEGEWLRENEPINDVEQHNVFTVFVDSEFQFFCDNIRHGAAVLHLLIPLT